jgi:hypothetical protein
VNEDIRPLISPLEPRPGLVPGTSDPAWPGKEIFGITDEMTSKSRDLGRNLDLWLEFNEKMLVTSKQ